MSKMNIAGIVQARMGSTRLTGKVDMKLAGKPLLSHVIERMKEIEKLDQIVVATSKEKEDERVVKIAKDEDVGFYRGPEKDVLRRYIEAGEKYDVDIIVRITGDNPLIDPSTINDLIDEFTKREEPDYYRLKGYPRGLDASICTLKVLKSVEEKITGDPKEEHYREHVTLYIYQHPEKFNIGFKDAPEHMKKDYRLSVDEEEDFELMKEIYERLYKDGKIIDVRDVFDLLDEHPEISKINSNVKQKEY